MTDIPDELTDWVDELAAVLNLDPAGVPVADLLELTRDAAHGVTRAAGPLTTYLVGVAVGRGVTPVDAAAAARVAIARRSG